MTKRWHHLTKKQRHHIVRLVAVGVIATFLAVAVDHKLAEIFAASALDAVLEGLLNAVD